MMHLPDAASSSYRRGDHPKRQDQESGKLAERSFQVPNINAISLEGVKEIEGIWGNEGVKKNQGGQEVMV